MKKHIDQETGHVDITRELVLAPVTKKAMMRRERELLGAERMLRAPLVHGLAPELQRLFTRNLTTGTADITKSAEPIEVGVNEGASLTAAARMHQLIVLCRAG